MTYTRQRSVHSLTVTHHCNTLNDQLRHVSVYKASCPYCNVSAYGADEIADNAIKKAIAEAYSKCKCKKSVFK